MGWGAGFLVAPHRDVHHTATASTTERHLKRARKTGTHHAHHVPENPLSGKKDAILGTWWAILPKTGQETEAGEGNRRSRRARNLSSARAKVTDLVCGEQISLVPRSVHRMCTDLVHVRRSAQLVPKH